MSTECPIGHKVWDKGLLDVRRAKLHRMGSRMPKGFDALLNAEVLAFSSLYEALSRSIWGEQFGALPSSPERVA